MDQQTTNGIPRLTQIRGFELRKDASQFAVYLVNNLQGVLPGNSVRMKPSELENSASVNIADVEISIREGNSNPTRFAVEIESTDQVKLDAILNAVGKTARSFTSRKDNQRTRMVEKLVMVNVSGTEAIQAAQAEFKPAPDR